MFCANCGKTLKNGASTCPHCGAPVGENHFQGLPYTAAQPKIAPGETEKLAEQFRPYTRTTYMGSGEPEGDVLSRTTYRPVLDEESASAPEDGEAPTQEAPASEGESAPEAEAAENRGNGVEALFDEPKGKDDAEDGAAPSSESDAQEDGEAEAVEDAVDIDPASIHVEPVKVDAEPEISEESKRILSGEAPVHNERVKRSLLTDKLPFGRKEADRPLFGEEEEEDGVPVPEDAAEVESDDTSSEEFDFGRGERARKLNFDYITIAKYAAIALVIIAVFVGGYLWIDYMISGRDSSPIDGVSQALYDSGTQYVSTLAEDAFRAEMIQLYQTDSLAFLERVDSMLAEADAMLPESPRENDALFIEAMRHIITNVGNALSVDSMNAPLLANASAEEQATINTASQNNWQIVQNGIAALSEATTATGLTNIINSQTVTVNVQQVEEIPQETEPTPDPSQYTSLSKDMRSEEVQAMQERLIELGYLDDSADGVFGNNTLIAVKFFQQDAGFDVDGIASPEMQALLFSEDAPRRATPSPSPDPSATVTPTQTPAP
ncbi:MAG TPA: peptidoglycan-binding protein [Candidatus Ornithocaccomicrobium faecavium]|uniref:Peptidoglycan-binding protein n=1 Tax=Candidatus Ornithocaccomicrobium faecavium TaxID=2840890 RepID=A0A9D1P5W3_9FIRM|nr:peptidoglycan-binding protein [Candidatus Ornithocaccomicrobium faecavium]